ncbi:MAG: acetyl-CoA carboxylase biotin carboxylase subunit [Candidatus Pacebacteria bacterium]|nr:acetyl-CoA carboxylase biotin carboxylase subunit [Candidatus Paceibacterota bacterium]
MFKRILIANRGEIALRIIRTCKRLNIETVVVYSQADKDAVYLKLADRAICIGPGPAKASYLKVNTIIAAAEIGDVEAVHPGYGFLSENAHFAEVCRACKITFIGPPTQVIETLGNKISARQLAKAAGVPTVPGSEGALSNVEEALAISQKIGYPVLLKAAAGGGGRGMRICHNDASLRMYFTQASNEAEVAFGDGTVYLEKYIESARHIEVQILADEHGNVIHLGERDCTIQRRNQKLIEESPSLAPGFGKRERYDIQVAAVRLMKTAKYANAGTVEFIYDIKAGKFYFMEVNTRLQVEHPVTEMVTGLDLVEEQLRVASGEPLRFRQKDIQFLGHAIECRINAEDPRNGFMPSPGKIGMFLPPAGNNIRMDTHMYAGYTVPPNYDSLLGKLIVHGLTRKEALLRMRFALDQMVLEGVANTASFLREILQDANFVAGSYDTSFVNKRVGPT